jgi:hypothetical protein
MFKDAGLQLATLIRFLKKAGYSHLAEITVNWPGEVASELLMKTNKHWVASLTTSSKPTIGGVPVKAALSNIEDPQTAVLQGSVLSIEFEEDMAGKRVDYYMLSNLMPVNFQYYGVPRETMDRVMSEFVSLTKVVATGNNMPPRLLALDHAIDIEGRLL